MNQRKILIIKTGYSEILEDRNNSREASLGEILRMTPILNLYRKDNVTWVTDVKAFPLLENNPFIHKLLPYDLTTTLQLEAEEFDTVINLEKIPGICALADKVRHRRARYGFTFNSQTGEAEAYDKATDVLAVSADSKLKKTNKRTVQELLFEMVGSKWTGEDYVLGYKPKKIGNYDVALNTKVGMKWPNKAWPDKNWDDLEELLKREGFKVSRQDKQERDVLKNLYTYMDWINSSKIIISNDSLGLHLGLALKKKVLGLFGPTPSSEVYFYGRGEAILPGKKFGCIPCFSGNCRQKKCCMDYITPKMVYEKIGKL